MAPWYISSLFGMTSKTKSLLRKDIKNAIKRLPEAIIHQGSEQVALKACSHPLFHTAAAVSLFLSMPLEINTDTIIRNAFISHKRVFIPKVIGINPSDMIMVELDSYDDISTFPTNNWGIPEPGDDFVSTHSNKYDDIIDLVFVPGVVFDKDCGRIGHGRGYYGTTISC
jgi:5-formyltetrahydrofolate cyclo-ligase